jgi:hypothetical protein
MGLANIDWLWHLRYIRLDISIGLIVTSRINPLPLLRQGTTPVAFSGPLPLVPPSSALVKVARAGSTWPPPRRAKIWELSRHLHCSIIGTCLSTSDLKHLLIKLDRTIDGATDHDLHGQGVLIAAQHDVAGKLLHKALDKRHRQSIGQFEKAKTANDVLNLWREAVKRGDIPGAYWATLTHVTTTDALVRIVFGEVHMLSHLVGAANRADIRRLAGLEEENAALRDKLRRQEAQLHEGMAARDAKIRDLGTMLARRIAESPERSAPSADSLALETLTKLVSDLKRRLTADGDRRVVLESRVERLAEQRRQEQAHRRDAETREEILKAELASLETAVTSATIADGLDRSPDLAGLTLLYVGGRPNQSSHLRKFASHNGIEMLCHDGGIDERGGLLAGLVSRADVVMFPVDCVSHDAVATIKRLCRQASKPFVPLRSSGISSFAAALGRLEISRLRQNDPIEAFAG